MVVYLDIFELPKYHNEIFFSIENSYTGLKIFNVIKTSLNLKIFDILEEKKNLKELSKELNMDSIKLEILLEILIKLNFLIKTDLLNSDLDEIFYENSEIANIYLNSNSPYYIKDYFSYYGKNLVLWTNLESTLKKKIVNKDNEIFVNVIKGMAFECLFGELKSTVDLINTYSEFQNAKTLLDIGGGHGLYSIAMSKLNPNLKAWVFDLSTVVEETQNFIKKYNSTISTISTISGNFFYDDFKNSYDLIFSSYNPGGKNPLIAKKVFDALNKGGLFLNKAYFTNENVNIGEYSLVNLLDLLEWNFTNLNSSDFKNDNLYSFEGDLNFNDYITYLKDLNFEILDIYDSGSFNKPVSNLFNVKFIVAKKL